MSNNHITPAQFTERYCPDYEERNHNKEEQVSFSGDWRIGVMLEDVMFADAIENFRQTVWQEACEAQREECAGTVRFESRIYLPEHLRDESYYACKNACIPEPTKNEWK